MSVLRGLAAAIDDAAPTGPRIAVRNGVIASVTPGAALDGNAQVAVTIGADTILAPYYDTYTPVVGHQVEVLLVDGSPRILGHLIGQPTI